MRGDVLAEIKASARLNRILELLLQNGLAVVDGQLEQIDARACAGEPSLIASRVPDIESRVQRAETEQRPSWRGRDVFQHLAALLVGKSLHDVPEHLDRGVFFVVISNDKDAAVTCVLAQVRDVDFRGTPADEGLKLGLVEHRKPRGLDH